MPKAYEIIDHKYEVVVVGAGVLDFLMAAGAFDHAVGMGEAAGNEIAGAEDEA